MEIKENFYKMALDYFKTKEVRSSRTKKIKLQIFGCKYYHGITIEIFLAGTKMGAFGMHFKKR
jgi:hypothetical protein